MYLSAPLFPVASAAVPSMAVVLLLFVHCCSHSFVGFCVWSMFCNVVLSVPSSFAVMWLRKKDLALYLYCALFLMVL